MALNTGRDVVFNLAYLLTATLLLSYLWAWQSLRSINLRRITRTRRGQVGEFAEETFEVTNRSRLPKLWLEIHDFSKLPWHAASRVISSLGPNSAYRWQVKTLCTERGRFRLGPIELRSGDPLGIFDRVQPLPASDYLVVYPMVVDLLSFEPASAVLSGGEARRRRTYEVTTNVASVRDYAPGDSLNRIHWPTTARTRRLMTKEFELDPSANVWIYLDLFAGAVAALPWKAQEPELGLFGINRNRRFALPPNSAEYAITLAASLARYFLLRNRAVGMTCQGRRRWFVQTDRGERQLGKIMEALSVVEAQGKLPFAQLIATDGMRLNRNDTIIAISADPSSDWARALQEVRRRGVNSMAVVIDGNSFGSERSYSDLHALLEAMGVSYYGVAEGASIDAALAQPRNASAA